MYEHLETIKAMLGITGNYHDTLLNGFADECIEYMVDSGVSRLIALSEKAKGTIFRGVSDLWDYGSGKGTLSPYFKERVIQLSYKDEEEVLSDHEKYHIPEEDIKEMVEKI